MIRSEGDDPSLQAASAAVAEAFAVRGWHAEAAVPQWRIEALYVERPRSLGAFVEQAAPEESDGWRISPTPHRWWRRDGRVGVLAVRIVDAATGAEVVRAEAKSRIAAEPTGPDLDLSDLDLLAQAVVAEALTGALQPSVGRR